MSNISDISATHASIKFIPIEKFESKLLVYECISDFGSKKAVLLSIKLLASTVFRLDKIRINDL